MAEKFIYRVAFNEPPKAGSPETEFYFSSLSAIYDMFTPEEIGCKVSRLWNIKVADGEPYIGKLCQIKRVSVEAKKQKKPSVASSHPSKIKDKPLDGQLYHREKNKRLQAKFNI